MPGARVSLEASTMDVSDRRRHQDLDRPAEGFFGRKPEQGLRGAVPVNDATSAQSGNDDCLEQVVEQRAEVQLGSALEVVLNVGARLESRALQIIYIVNQVCCDGHSR